MDELSLNSRIVLNNNCTIPRLGIGVYLLEEGVPVENVVLTALEIGYRLIDTATIYRNEAGVGCAIQRSGISRKDLFVTSKVWNDDQGYEETLRAFEKSIKNLKLDYLDSYLIHWPIRKKLQATWTAMEKLYEEGLTASIGVSNFSVSQLIDLQMFAKIQPMINQIEFHPFLIQHDLIEYCTNYQMQLEAYSPLMQGKFVSVELFKLIGQKYKKSAAQILLRWHIQKGVVAILKTVNLERLRANADIFNFILSDYDMNLIDSLNINKRFGSAPERYYL